jgi:beta-glucosidase
MLMRASSMAAVALLFTTAAVEGQPGLHAALAPAQVVAPESAFTAVTLNLWHDQQDWPARRAVIVDTLRALAPDVILLQEVLEKEGLPNQARQLADSLGCAFVFASVDPPGAAKRYGNAILTRLPIVASSEVKLPPLDDWRVAAHARLALPDGRALDAYVTHLHHTEEGAAIRAEQVAGLLAFVDSTRSVAADAALLVGGDFNAEPDRPELAPVFARFTDVLAAVHPDLELPAAATIGPATGTTPRRIDYLFCDGAQLTPTAARVVLGAPSPAGVWGSDHCGVWARFWPGAAAPARR